MSADAPHVDIDVPAGWAVAELERPPIGEDSGPTWAQWTARESPPPGPGPHSTMAAGCVATPIPGWVEDMQPAVAFRTVGLLAAAASKMLGAPSDLRPVREGVFELRRADSVAGPATGLARTFIGFDESRVLTCFAACVDRSERSCTAAVDGARLVGSLEPPPPKLGLRAVTWAVHHPQPTALGAAALLVVGAVAFVAFRRRPRSTIAPKKAMWRRH